LCLLLEVFDDRWVGIPSLDSFTELCVEYWIGAEIDQLITFEDGGLVLGGLSVGDLSNGKEDLRNTSFLYEFLNDIEGLLCVVADSVHSLYNYVNA